MSISDRRLTDSDTQDVHVAAMNVYNVEVNIRAHAGRVGFSPDLVRAEMAVRAAHAALMVAVDHVSRAVGHVDQ